MSSQASQGPPERLVRPPWLEPLQRDLERTVERLQGRSLARLDRPLEPAGDGHTAHGPTAAQAAAALAQQLVDVTASLEGRPPQHLPDVEVHVLPDLLAVAGNDLVLALCGYPQAADAQRQAAVAAAALRSLRHAL